MLIGRYILFSLTLLAMVFLALTVTVNSTAGERPGKKIKELSEAFSKVPVNQYDSVDVEKYLGKKGYAQILDPDLDVVYSSSSDRIRTRYTQREIDMISDYNESVNVSIKEIYDEQRGLVAEVTITHINSELERADSELYLIDEDGKFLYSSREIDAEELSERELNLIENAISRRYNVAKYKFIDTNGNERILIGYSSRDFRFSMERIYDKYISMGIKFLAAYFFLVLLFSVLISRKVGKPIRMLQTAMDKVASGSVGEKVEYSGPKEFVDMCDRFNDMSERLAEYEEEKRSVQQKKQRLVASISHDLKTPVTVIKGYSKTLLDGFAEPGEEKKYIAAINQKADYIAELINDFSEYAQAGDSDYTYSFQRTDICEYLREFFANRYADLEIGGRVPVIDIPEEEIYAEIDGKKFYRVCSNILNNYLKYAPPEARLFCSVAEEGDKVVISFGDDGRGVSEEIKDDIFDPFVTGDNSRSGSGSGLGLAFVKKVIEDHGGSISLKSPPDPGLNFQLVIRLKGVK